jgi:lysophospholipid acyltransferase (LPLAT)-like uncharacterized protein
MLRRLRFLLLERVVLPLAIVPFKLLVWSWRKIPPDAETVRRLVETPRAVLVTYHGMFLQLVAFAPLLDGTGRKWVVMLSPSLDGRLLAAFLARFGIDHVRASTARRGTGGSLALIRRLRRGDVGIVAVDGPRGPCCVAQPGFERLAAGAEASIVLAVAAAERGVGFGSWDRAQLPLPFARVRLVLDFAGADGESAANRLLAAARDLGSAVVPPALALAPEARAALDMDSSPPR